jgi:hypothetical protein
MRNQLTERRITILNNAEIAGEMPFSSGLSGEILAAKNWHDGAEKMKSQDRYFDLYFL